MTLAPGESARHDKAGTVAAQPGNPLQFGAVSALRTAEYLAILYGS